MKITDFEIGKKYRMPHWNGGTHIYFDETGVIYRLHREVNILCHLDYNEIVSDKWEEYIDNKIEMKYPDTDRNVLIKIGQFSERMAFWDRYSNEWGVLGVNGDGFPNIIMIKADEVISWRDIPNEQENEEIIKSLRQEIKSLKQEILDMKGQLDKTNIAIPQVSKCTFCGGTGRLEYFSGHPCICKAPLGPHLAWV